MRFTVARAGEGTAVFGLDGSEAVNLTAASPELGDDLSALTRMGAAGLDLALAAMRTAVAGLPAEKLEPALPIRRPGKIVCLGLNYVEHAKEGGYDIPDYPAMFMRPVTSMIPAGAPLVRPECSETLDYEAELMVIIGAGGRHVAEDAALDHVFGYTTFNDGSVREYQRKTHQWAPGKMFDDTGAVGPVVVTPDEVPPGASGLRIATRLNGVTMQESDTANMMFPVAKTIAIVSEFTTLEPGDLIALGTPPGVGHARRPPVWMKPGDVVEVEIDGIGLCRNPIVSEGDGRMTEAAE